MKEVVYNIHEYIKENDIDFLFVPTNGYIKKSGDAVCGVGILKYLSEQVKFFPFVLGQKIKANGNTVQHIMDMEFGVKKVSVCSFPVKPKSAICDGTNAITNRYKVGSTLPGWAVKCDKRMVFASTKNMIDLIKEDK